MSSSLRSAPDFLPEGGTNYRQLIDTSIEAFGESAAADRYLIILSDGEATDDDWKSRVPELEKKGVRVIGLGVGTSGGGMIPDGAGAFMKDDNGAVVLSRLEDGTLRELTSATHGVYRDASEWVDLPRVLASTVDEGRKGRFVEHNSVRYVERYQWALAQALACLVASFWLEFPVRPKSREIRLSAAPTPKAKVPRPSRRRASCRPHACRHRRCFCPQRTLPAEAPNPAAALLEDRRTPVGPGGLERRRLGGAWRRDGHLGPAPEVIEPARARGTGSATALAAVGLRRESRPEGFGLAQDAQ